MKTKGVVIDASYVMSWLLPDERSPEPLREAKIAPELLRYEVINSLRSAVKQRRVDPETSEGLLKEFGKWNVEYVKMPEIEVLRTALNNNISGYDACYVWLAKEKGAELLTFDKKLVKLV